VITGIFACPTFGAWAMIWLLETKPIMAFGLASIACSVAVSAPAASSGILMRW
jgi:hypothetical protein